MSPTTIKELDGLPAGEIRELVKDGDRRVEDDARKARERIVEGLGGRMSEIEGRMGQVETRLGAVEVLAKEAVELGKANNAQNTEILKRLEGLQGEVREVETKTADGTKIATRVTRWGETARDLHLAAAGKLLARWGLPLILGWVIIRMFGPEVGKVILHKLFGW